MQPRAWLPSRPQVTHSFVGWVEPPQGAIPITSPAEGDGYRAQRAGLHCRSEGANSNSAA